jgi:PadR family transcriptional regulator, regulatory protein PadR
VETPLSARAALLHALRIPGYGLELMARVRRGTGGSVRLRGGSVYPALRALEARGLVRSIAVKGAGKGRPRHYYELTAAGVRAAAAQRAGLLGFLMDPPGRPGPRTDVKVVRHRLEECSDLSGALLELRRQVQDAARRGR